MDRDDTRSDFPRMGFGQGLGKFGPDNLFKPCLKLNSNRFQIVLEQVFWSKRPQTLSKTLSRKYILVVHDLAVLRIILIFSVARGVPGEGTDCHFPKEIE
jgi:hypothetical protein